MANKKLNIFREFSLKEILEYFNNKDYLASYIDNPNLEGYLCEVQIDDEHENDVGFFSGAHCVGSLSSKDMLKLTDHDKLEVIKSDNVCNVGVLLKFHLVKTHSFI